jgi:hypothetical protein
MYCRRVVPLLLPAVCWLQLLLGGNNIGTIKLQPLLLQLLSC